MKCDRRNMESSPLLLLEGYNFISKRCRKYGTNVFQTRLLCNKVICMKGADAAKLFYDERYFKRKGVAPKMIQKTLFGQHGVQGLDGMEHKQRKQMFMSIMTPENMEILQALSKEQWEVYSKKWERECCITLFDQVQEIMTKVACEWAGVPIKESEIKLRADDFGKMVDGFGSFGCRYWMGKCARNRTEMWIKDIIKQIRSNKIKPDKTSAAYTIAWNYDMNGELLNPQVAAVELINIIRPIVAIATYITFGALAMYRYPGCRRKLQSNDDSYPLMFIQEVRRYYPFAPFVGARVKKSFYWKNVYFKRGAITLFDIYGTNHDPRYWDWPNKFHPERFANKKENLYAFVPQGGGDPHQGHRCAGELVTINIMKESLLFLANKMEYRVPKQNLNYCLRRIPTLPKSRFKITQIHLK
jgi:fatty-acid peroxygenase